MGIPRLLTATVTAVAAVSAFAASPAHADTGPVPRTSASAGQAVPGPAGNPVWAHRMTQRSVAALTTVSCNPTTSDATTATKLASAMTYSRMGRLLTADQVSCARRIVAGARATGLDRKGAEIALMTAIVETTLRDYTGGDLDSVGLFQQRPSWGTYAQRITPEPATATFLGVMQQFYPSNTWLTAPAGQVAADVQRPAAAYRGEYVLAQSSADALLDVLWPLATPAPTPTPAPAPTPPKQVPRPAQLRVLHAGMRGADVKYAQQLLNLLGAHLGVDGADGPATSAAIKTFQRQQHLSVDGIVGPLTWSRLQAATGQQTAPVAKPKPAPKPTSKPTTKPKPTPKPKPKPTTKPAPKPASKPKQVWRPAQLRVLHAGMRGADVKYAQQLLNLFGAHLGVDGADGPATSAAIRTFQHRQHLSVDGIVGPHTWSRLQTATGQQKAPVAKPKPTPKPATHKPASKPTHVWRPAQLRVLHAGMRGADVKYAQQLLNLFGAHLGVDGADGPATSAAIRTFQHRQHLSVDGIVGPHTWSHLQAATGQ